MTKLPFVFAFRSESDYSLQFASLVLAIFPTVLFYAVFRRRIASGFSQGAAKE